MILVIETATPACSVALVSSGGDVIAERHEVVGRGHAERLLPMIAEILGNGLPALIAVDCGPGSFTGVRVGLAAARALALAWGVEVGGFSSLSLLATRTVGEVVVAISGGHGELFVQPFIDGSASGPLVSLTPIDAACRFAQATVVGSGAMSLVSARGSGQAHDRLPRAADFWRLPTSERERVAAPLYGREPDAKPSVAVKS